jgi:hypothetical protein
MSVVQGRVVSNYPLSAAFVVTQPRLFPLSLGPIERKLNRVRVETGRDKGTIWWLSRSARTGELFTTERVYDICRSEYEDCKWTAKTIGECRVLTVPE